LAIFTILSHHLGEATLFFPALNLYTYNHCC